MSIVLLPVKGNLLLEIVIFRSRISFKCQRIPVFLVKNRHLKCQRISIFLVMAGNRKCKFYFYLKFVSYAANNITRRRDLNTEIPDFCMENCFASCKCQGILIWLKNGNSDIVWSQWLQQIHYCCKLFCDLLFVKSLPISSTK